jgi:hypothetical protein
VNRSPRREAAIRARMPIQGHRTLFTALSRA